MKIWVVYWVGNSSHIELSRGKCLNWFCAQYGRLFRFSLVVSFFFGGGRFQAGKSWYCKMLYLVLLLSQIWWVHGVSQKVVVVSGLPGKFGMSFNNLLPPTNLQQNGREWTRKIPFKDWWKVLGWLQNRSDYRCIRTLSTGRYCWWFRNPANHRKDV